MHICACVHVCMYVCVCVCVCVCVRRYNPYSTADGQGSKTMAFILPNEVSESAPSPSKGDEISIQRLPAQTVAVLEFPGFATEKEIKAQKEKLLSSLQTDGRFTPIDDTDSFRVLQWNPPYTLPWLRRNEICIKVKEVESAAGSNVVLDAVE
mmetsp:Transcript_16501/g.26357  ORF Transcript_16501/g.26357 Transcript_16501/m.26357 type:complete len:152 (+) Transcript_16501:214-669(+)